LNFHRAVQDTFHFSEPLTIVDSTIRKILYTGTNRPTVAGMLKVAEGLAEVGVRQITLNVRWWGDKSVDPLEYRVSRAVLAADLGFKAIVTSDSLVQAALAPAPSGGASVKAILDGLEKTGADTISISARVPPSGGAYARVKDAVSQVAELVKQHGHPWALSIGDVGRVDFKRLIDLASTGIDEGACELELSDSYSSLSPEAMRLFVGQLTARIPRAVPVTIHTHNDFGLASATAIAAATAGAQPDVSVNGLSYRAGFASLEEVVLALELLYGVHTGIRLDKLVKLSELVAKYSNLPIHPLKAISGRNAYIRDLPPWIREFYATPNAGFPPVAACFSPSLVGRTMEVRWGVHQSDSAIRAKLENLGLTADEQQVREIRRRIRLSVNEVTRYPFSISDSKVASICKAVMKGSRAKRRQ
jgi:hypothetical protein